GFAKPVGYSLLSVTRGGVAVDITPSLKLSGGDVLAFAVPVGILPGLWATIGLVPLYATKKSTPRYQHHLVEVVVSPNAPGVGRLISELPLPNSPYIALLVGI